MPLIPYSKRYPDAFLTRGEDNFETFLEQLRCFYKETRADIQDGKTARRKLNHRFDYQKELQDAKIPERGISTDEIALEFNDMLQGCVRHHDPTTAFNMIPSPLFASVAGITLTALYNPNACWDFISGKLCLYEKKIVRMLGSMVGWSHPDGFVITGGKQSLAYAIKTGMGRASVGGRAPIDEYVVICSALAHYSVEHVCHYLGIAPQNCLRVTTTSSGEIDLKTFEETLERVISQNKKIAAVIAVGGGTIDLIPDPIASMKQSIDRIAQSRSLDYIPYLHVDSVITWAWLAFTHDGGDCANDRIHPHISQKIRHVVSKLFQASNTQILLLPIFIRRGFVLMLRAYS
jgi:glutamate/tyrosine decarboxylase-like PLP-dependent enzyme